MKNLFAFVRRLEDAKIWFRLIRNRHDAISVEVVAPGERWEVDFSDDGTVDVERFRSDGSILDETVLEELFVLCSNEENPVPHESI